MNDGNLGNILVVDDEIELKNVLVEALTTQGYDAAGYASGQEALEALHETPFDVILTDLMMPQMDGISLLRASLEIDPHVICIVMTGHGTIQTAVDAMKVGAFDYVLKPFRMTTILPVLTRAMNTRRLRLENLQLRETVAIYELCQTIAFTLDQQTIISKLADGALQQTSADEVSILLPTSSGEELYVAAVRGDNRRRLLGERVPLEESISGWVVRERQPLILAGEVSDDRFRPMWPHPEIRSSISVPMQIANKLVGTININALNRRRPFTLGQMKALTILSSTAAAALESASLYSQVRDAEESYRSIFENAVEGIFQTTPEGAFSTVNPALARILGYESPEEVVSNIADIAKQLYVNPDDRRKSEEVEARDGVLRGFEFEARRKNGEKIWLLLNRRTNRDEQGVELFREGSIEDITERKRAEAALRESERRYRDMIENARDIIYSHDLSGKYTSMNRAGGDITGYTVEEALAMSMIDTVAPEYIPRAREMTQRKLAGENVTAYEMEILAKDGHRIPVEVNTWLMHQDGIPVGVTGIARDITQRKEAEAQLRFQKSLLEAQNEASIDGILVVALDGNILSYNRRFCELWGLSEEQLAAKDDQSALESVINLVAAPEKFLARVKYLYEHPDETSQQEIELKDGRVFDRHSAPVRGPAGEYYGRVWYFHDITDRKRAQAELTRLAAAVQQTADSILITDPAGNIEYVNPAFERITGYSNEEALGHNPRILKSGKNSPATYADLWQTIKRGDVWEGQLVNKRKDGTLFSERATISAVRDESGKIKHFVAVKKDVTHEIQLEDQLRQSQKMEAIGQLAGGVAHDFNNLLTAINGYSSLALQRIAVDSPIKSYLEEIKKAGDRAANLTRQLLAFGRKQILQPVPINLNDIVTDMNKMLRRLIGEDIVLNAKLDPNLKTIKADSGQIEQVLVNLVVNARDAMPSGGNLTIETASIELDSEYAGKRVGVVPGRYVMLAVSDTGIGMNEATRARIFDPFFTTKDKGKGTGLGLSTVYGIVKQSGGNIWVYSEEGRGTTFKVYLPQIETAEKIESLKPETEIPHGSETILLLEDEDIVRNLTCQILESAGYKVVEAARGEEAIKSFKAENGSIDLLLTDVVMPEMSGKEVADRICELRPSMKVLFMSGYTDEAIVHHGVLDSNVQFIQKPFTPAALAIKIREVLEAD
jgi:PAS domain S-box-containing protein